MYQHQPPDTADACGQSDSYEHSRSSAVVRDHRPVSHEEEINLVALIPVMAFTWPVINDSKATHCLIHDRPIKANRRRHRLPSYSEMEAVITNNMVPRYTKGLGQNVACQ